MFFRRAHRYLTVSLTGLLMLAALQTAASAAPADVIYLESNSTSGNSIFAFKFNFTSSPTLMSATPAGGIGVFDPTFALQARSIPIRISPKTPAVPCSSR